MSWRMPAETAPHERTWMAFPREGITLGERAAPSARRATRPGPRSPTPSPSSSRVTMVVDPTELRARPAHAVGEIEILEAPLDEFWMRDFGPTFVVDDERPGVLGAVDWIFNGWGAPEWAEWAQVGRDRPVRRGRRSAPSWSSSVLVNEGGGIHVDGEGTVLVTETVQLDPRRNPYADKRARRGRARPHDRRRPRDLAAARTHPRLRRLRHERPRRHRRDDPVARPPAAARPAEPRRTPTSRSRASCARCSPSTTDAAGRRVEIIDLPAPETLRDDEGFVDWSYVNHLVVNDGVIACGFGEERADAAAREHPRGRLPRPPGRDRRRAADLRPRRRHPLHHAAAAGGRAMSGGDGSTSSRRRSPTCAPRSSRARHGGRAARARTSRASRRTTGPAPRPRSTRSSS